MELPAYDFLQDEIIRYPSIVSIPIIYRITYTYPAIVSGASNLTSIHTPMTLCRGAAEAGQPD
jgi:hypothetical protein